MNPICPNISCHKGPKDGQMVRNGYNTRKSDSKKIQRFRCPVCGKSTSSATGSPNFMLKKKRINNKCFELLNSSTSQRRTAILLGVDKKTVERRAKFFHVIYKTHNKNFLIKNYQNNKITKVQFDEMESFIHTKLKPTSVPLAVCADTRKILDIQTASMPANGLNAHKSVEKYGKRPDDREEALDRLFENIKPFVDPEAVFISDSKTIYPKLVRKHFPKGTHISVKGRRSAIVGQGELKKIGYDPLFSLNHTCAMIRDNVKRLSRKTWCTSKTMSGLQGQLSMYAYYHNTELT